MQLIETLVDLWKFSIDFRPYTFTNQPLSKVHVFVRQLFKWHLTHGTWTGVTSKLWLCFQAWALQEMMYEDITMFYSELKVVGWKCFCDKLNQQPDFCLAVDEGIGAQNSIQWMWWGLHVACLWSGLHLCNKFVLCSKMIFKECHFILTFYNLNNKLKLCF